MTNQNKITTNFEAKRSDRTITFVLKSAKFASILPLIKKYVSKNTFINNFLKIIVLIFGVIFTYESGVSTSALDTLFAGQNAVVKYCKKIIMLAKP